MYHVQLKFTEALTYLSLVYFCKQKYNGYFFLKA